MVYIVALSCHCNKVVILLSKTLPKTGTKRNISVWSSCLLPWSAYSLLAGGKIMVSLKLAIMMKGRAELGFYQF